MTARLSIALAFAAFALAACGTTPEDRALSGGAIGAGGGSATTGGAMGAGATTAG